MVQLQNFQICVVGAFQWCFFTANVAYRFLLVTGHSFIVRPKTDMHPHGCRGTTALDPEPSLPHFFLAMLATALCALSFGVVTLPLLCFHLDGKHRGGFRKTRPPPHPDQSRGSDPEPPAGVLHHRSDQPSQPSSGRQLQERKGSRG